MMKVKSIYIAISIVLLTMTFASCNEETLYDGPCKVRFVASVQDEVNVTRATEDEKYPGYTPFTPTDFNAELFVSYETETPGVTPTAPGYTISWEGSALSTPLALETGEYKFYGYAPHLEGSTFDNTTKTLAIPNIPGLFDKDLLVINPCSTKIEASDIDKKKAVDLRMDHLMAKITPCFYLNSTYEELRDIRIKKVEFFFEEAPTYTATINYTTSPYTPTWDSDGTNDKCDVEAYSIENSTSADNLPPTKKDNDENPQVYKECGHCYIVPEQFTTNLKMEVTYDVYDKSGTLTRVNATATNLIKKLPNKLEAGKNYKLNIQIIPTYLYVLSDNDESSVLVIPNN